MLKNSRNLIESKKRKHEPFPEKLKSTKLYDIIHSISDLNKRVCSTHRNEGQLTPERIVKTLIRGLGSSNTQVQKNYFTALVTLIQNNHESVSELSVSNLLETVRTELHISGSSTKGEDGEILLGQVLVFGALVRSGALQSASVDDQASAVSQLLRAVKAKSYLPPIADPFLVDYLKQMKESVFKKAVWPTLSQEVRPGPEQTLLIYHVLLVCEQLFPSTVTPKFLKQTLTSPTVLSPITVPALVTLLKADYKIKNEVHPAFLEMFKQVSSSPEDVLGRFWQEVESQLLSDAAVHKKQTIAIKFFTLLVKHLQNASQILSFLTERVLMCLTKRATGDNVFVKLLHQACKEAVDAVYMLCKQSEDPKTVLHVIRRLLFHPGMLLFEHNSGTKVVTQLLTHLKEKGVTKLAKLLRDVITGISTAVEVKDNQPQGRPYHNKEKLYAVHLFSKLVSLPVVQPNLQWRIEQLNFLFDIGFFPAPSSNIGVELADHVRESFFSCLNQKSPNLDDLQNILAGIVEHVNNRFNNGDQLRIKISPEVMPAWQQMYTTVIKIGKSKRSKDQWLIKVFQTMFYHIGLHLFKEAAFAVDVLKELQSVYVRIDSSNLAEEPHWLEVVVEMFLSLLSRNSQLHRHLTSCIFSHFCPIMTPQNIHQILQVLDPTSDSNPLLSSLDSDSETSSDDDMVGDEDDEADKDEESSDDGMTDEEEEEDEKVNDKLRRAVLEALGDNGAMTDVESVDLDTMDDAEAERVDRALSEAFRAVKPSKSKKQSSHARALTNFRLRVLDLIEVWLVSSEPSLDLIVDTLLKLVSLLEHALVDKHQAPLETRVRSVIKKVASNKKYNATDCQSLHLGNILKKLLEKGDRTTTVYMSIIKELNQCALFIVKAYQHTEPVEEAGDEVITVPSVLKDLVSSYFLQRDCLLTPNLFQDLFSLNLPFICTVAAKLPKFVFDTNVHPFRRSKALEFLISFWKKNRILAQATEEQQQLLMKMSKRLYKESVKMMDEPKGRIQPKFLTFLRKAFNIIAAKKWLPDVDWTQHLHNLGEFQKKYLAAAKKERKLNGCKDTTAEVEVENEEGQSQSESEQEEEEDIQTENNINLNKSKVEDEDLQSEERGENEESEEEENVETDHEKLGDNDDSDEEGDAGSEEDDTGSEENDEESQDSNNVEVTGESVVSGSESEEPPNKKSKKKVDKRRSKEKLKRIQLLKNNSKKLRMESMAVGLEENLFSKYKILLNKTSSPDR